MVNECRVLRYFLKSLIRKTFNIKRHISHSKQAWAPTFLCVSHSLHAFHIHTHVSAFCDPRQNQTAFSPLFGCLLPPRNLTRKVRTATENRSFLHTRSHRHSLHCSNWTNLEISAMGNAVSAKVYASIGMVRVAEKHHYAIEWIKHQREVRYWSAFGPMNHKLPSLHSTVSAYFIQILSFHDLRLCLGISSGIHSRTHTHTSVDSPKRYYYWRTMMFASM